MTATTDYSDWYDIADPATVDALQELDVSRADRLRDRREMKRVFHAFGIVRNEADGRLATFPAASVGKMLYMSGTDVRGIAAAFADLYRASVRAWSEPNRKIPASDRRRAHEAVHQYVAKFRNAQGRFYVRFTVKANTGGSSPRSEVHASVISRISIYASGADADGKGKGAELSTPANTRAEDSTPFTDDKISYYLSEVNRAKFARRGMAFLNGWTFPRFLKHGERLKSSVVVTAPARKSAPSPSSRQGPPRFASRHPVRTARDTGRRWRDSRRGRPW